ncbi:histidinol dehydrogenase [Sinorhizobium psoraleae]|uniref:Histidinol dehydrogenase n=1 Tax=Sinorhizobium psoraleae TaxID=520838 RepID=A0ABT4KPI3_9HYPH|nr:histidinol dehydrogenase [Sinorhizobium psoraleae]MCZ4093893.1 histidinol dehydrogenase [Sinorhizobium psoraleae]
MAITHLKRGKPDTLRIEEHTQVRSVVEGILSDIEMRGDAAIRELSAKFDKYMPESFRLSEGDIDALMNRVSPRDIADIKFAQAQVRNFAQAQRNSIKDIEVETLPG